MRSSEAEGAIGRVLGGRYRVVRLLGEGGMGAVYEAVQEDLGRRVAVKIIADALIDHPDYVERFRREAQAAARLGHPNIVQVTDFHPGAPGEPPFMVLEYLDGEPLNAALKRARLHPTRAVAIIQQVLAALGVAHSNGIVHRDLKPGNVYLVPVGGGAELVKLLDFGVAKLMDTALAQRLTATGVMVGTPRYAAPEQIRDSSAVGPATDLYAAGALLYCMLVGRPPYSSSGAQLLVDVETKEPPDPRLTVTDLDPGLVAVVQRAMRKSPAQRFGSAAEMSTALTPFASPSIAGRPDDATVQSSSPTGMRAVAPAPTGTATATARGARSSPVATAPDPSKATVGAIPSARAGQPSAHDFGATAGAIPSALGAPQTAPGIPATGGRGWPAEPAILSTGTPERTPPWTKLALVFGVGIVLVLLASAGVGGWLFYEHQHQEASTQAEPGATEAAGGAATDPFLDSSAGPRLADSLPTPASFGVPACDRRARQACSCSNALVRQSTCNQIHEAFNTWRNDPSWDRDSLARNCETGYEQSIQFCGEAPVAPAAVPAGPPPLAVPASFGVPECDAYARQACGCSGPTFRASMCASARERFEDWRTTAPAHHGRLAEACTTISGQISGFCGPAT